MVVLKISDNCQENTNTGKDRLKLQACNYIYKKGQPGTGVFLRMLRNIKHLQRNGLKIWHNIIQKQPFTDFLQNTCFLKFLNTHRKTPVLESLFNKVADLKARNLIKRDFNTCFPVNIEKFLRIVFL